MTGALALSFAFSGIPFQLSASSLQGDHFVQYAYPDTLAGNPGNALEESAGKLIGIGSINNTIDAGGNYFASDTVTQLKSAAISDLRQSICAPTPLGVSIKVHIIGTGNTTASNLTIQAPALTADSAEFSRIRIGETVKGALLDQGFDPGEFTDPYNALSGSPIANSFAQGADSVTLTNIDQVGVGTEAGTFRIGGLKLYAEFVGSC